MTTGMTMWLVTLLALLGYELFALITKRELLTTAVRRASKKTLLVPFLTGVLMGHFFFCGCP